MRVPSRLNTVWVTPSVWPSRVWISWPVRTSHSRAVLSQEAVTTRVPSGLNAASEMDATLGIDVPLPAELDVVKDKQVLSSTISGDFDSFKRELAPFRDN